MTAHVEAHESTAIVVPARIAATGWINAFLASGTDDERPVLFQTLSLEWFDEGLQIVGCDGTALFRSWVPTEVGRKWPLHRREPERRVIIMDTEGFGLAFMRSLLRVTNDEAHEHEELTVSTAPADEGATLSLGAAFTTERLILRACGQRIDLRLMEDKYPDWRKLQLGIDDSERVAGFTIATRLFAMVGKLKGVGAIDVKSLGDRKAIAFEADGDAPVRGLLAAMRKETPAVEREPKSSATQRELSDEDKEDYKATVRVNGGDPMPMAEFKRRAERGEIDLRSMRPQ